MPEPALTVLKLGGAVCRDAAHLNTALVAIGLLASRTALVVVPGGGAFADQVRATQRDHALSDDAAHWMAILAMDMTAHQVADQLGEAQLIRTREAIAGAHASSRIPVLAPYAWLRATDALPHSWDVTSDSIAAFLAGELGARTLILLKPVDGPVEAVVDRAFASLLPRGMPVRVATPWTLGAVPAR